MREVAPGRRVVRARIARLLLDLQPVRSALERRCMALNVAVQLRVVRAWARHVGLLLLIGQLTRWLA